MARRGKKRQRISDEDEDDYAIKAIVGETSTQYQVVWEDSWVPKNWVNQAAVAEWEERKADISTALSSPLSEVDDADLEAIAKSTNYRPEPSAFEGPERALRKVSPTEESSTEAANSSAEVVSPTHTESQIQVAWHSPEPVFNPRAQTLVITSSETLNADTGSTASATKTTQHQSQVDPTTDCSKIEVSALLSQSTTETSQTSLRVVDVDIPAGYESYDQTVGSQAAQHDTHIYTVEDHIVAATAVEETAGAATSQYKSSQIIPDSLDSMSLPPHLVEPMSAPGSPSIVPAIIKHRMPTLEEQTTSERLETLLPRKENVAERRDGAALPGNYVLLPMLPQQRDQYKTLPDLAFKDMDLADVIQGERLLRRLSAVAVHPDLDNDEIYTQYDVDAETHTSWDISVSSKFAFLNALFKRPGHYGIVAKGFKMRALCKQFINGLGLAGVAGTTRVSLLDQESDVDLIIDLDGTATPTMRRARYVRVMVPYTVEHFDESISITGDSRIATIVAAVEEYRSLAGIGGNIDEAAEAVIAYIGGTPLPAVHRVDLKIVEGVGPPPTKKPRIDLTDDLLKARRRADEWEFSFEKLLDDHQKQTEDLRSVTAERDAATENAQRAAARSQVHQQNVAKYREEVIELKDALRKAQASLLDHTIPTRAEIERMKQAVAKADETASNADGRIQRVKKDLEYAQEMYRTASSQAVQLAEENADLEKRLAKAEFDASGEKVRLLQIRLDDATQKILEENDHMKAILASREDVLKHRDEEISRLSRGRAMRSTSVPRSPMRSPAAGERKLHPLRNGVV